LINPENISQLKSAIDAFGGLVLAIQKEGMAIYNFENFNNKINSIAITRNQNRIKRIISSHRSAVQIVVIVIISTISGIIRFVLGYDFGAITQVITIPMTAIALITIWNKWSEKRT